MMNELLETQPQTRMLEWFASAQRDQKRVVFLDRDGVINEHIAGGYVLKPGDFRWLPDVLPELRRLTNDSRALFVVTNQSCINQGLLAPRTLASIMTQMVSTMRDAGVECSGWVCCPHRVDEGCACRKPCSAMLERVASVSGASLSEAVLIGDSLSDVQAAQRVGTRGFLVERNNPQSLTAVVDCIVGGAR